MKVEGHWAVKPEVSAACRSESKRRNWAPSPLLSVIRNSFPVSRMEVIRSCSRKLSIC